MSARMRASRTTERERMGIDTRMTLVEGDLDDHEGIHTDLAAQFAGVKRGITLLTSTVAAGVIVDAVTRLLHK